MPIDLLVLSAALLAGLLGGVHCVAMCGGIATTLGGSAAKGFHSALALNLGRVLGYALAGAVVGGLGGGLLQLARIEGLAQSLRTLVGVVMLLAAARLLWPSRFRLLATPGAGLWRWLQPLRARVMALRGPMRPLLLGTLWGWMPCGLSTTVLVAAWLEASALHGGLLMLAFGLGTLPLMTSLSWSGAHFARMLARPAWRGMAATMIACAGSLTLAAPWLAQVPALHGALEAMGCRSLVTAG